jgi:hypothetical protein
MELLNTRLIAMTGLLPAFCSLSDTKLPDDRIYDGYDISPLLFGTRKSDRDDVFYYRG